MGPASKTEQRLFLNVVHRPGRTTRLGPVHDGQKWLERHRVSDPGLLATMATEPQIVFMNQVGSQSQNLFSSIQSCRQ